MHRILNSKIIMLSLILTFTLIVIIFTTRKKLRITSLNTKKLMTSLSTISSMISQKPKNKTSIEMEMLTSPNKTSETIGDPFDFRTMALETNMFQDTFRKTMNVVYNNRENATVPNKAILDLIETFA